MANAEQKFDSLVKEFYEQQKKLKDSQKAFNELKEEFSEKMESLFKSFNNQKMTFDYDEFEGSGLVVNRIQKSNVEFDCDKLERALGKELSKNVIQKKYEVIDMNGLIRYLKECGVNPKVFKKFINVSKFVNEKELDRLEELGKISIGKINGCYSIKHQKPYFTVKVKKGNDDG